MAPAPDLEDPTSGVLEQLSFVESQEELPIVHLPPRRFKEFHAKRALGLSQVPLLLSICGQPVFRASFLRSWVVCRVSSRKKVHGERLRVGEGGLGRPVRGHLRLRRHRQRHVVLLEEAENSVASEGHCGGGDTQPLPAWEVHQRFCVMTKWAEHHGTRQCAAQARALRRPARSGRTSCGPRSRRLFPIQVLLATILSTSRVLFVVCHFACFCSREREIDVRAFSGPSLRKISRTSMRTGPSRDTQLEKVFPVVLPVVLPRRHKEGRTGYFHE